MSLNNTPSANRIHIGVFGKRNAGKSSLLNALSNQSLAIVSDVPGTTTDPVSKSMELLPLGPVILIDTPGLDDVGELGNLRIEKAYQSLNKTDLALLVIDSTVGITAEDQKILERIQAKKIPCILVFNKTDLASISSEISEYPTIQVSTKTGLGIQELKELIGSQAKNPEPLRHIVADLLEPLDVVVLVIPIDESAPKGRLILPQQQTLRDILDCGAIGVVCKDMELTATLQSLGKKPRLVITDSQVFEKVALEVPRDIALTSFSILFARYKGDLEQLVQGAQVIEQLQDGDTVLISEGCTHHRQCNDIGTVKLPGWLQKHTGKSLQFAFTSGTEFPTDLQNYKLIIHCGGCMLNQTEMRYRLSVAKDQNVPMTNYGTAIAYMNGILNRATEMFF